LGAIPLSQVVAYAGVAFITSGLGESWGTYATLRRGEEDELLREDARDIADRVVRAAISLLGVTREDWDLSTKSGVAHGRGAGLAQFGGTGPLAVIRAGACVAIVVEIFGLTGFTDLFTHDLSAGPLFF